MSPYVTWNNSTIPTWKYIAFCDPCTIDIAITDVKLFKL